MAWEWSHTAEAYRDAELNLRELPTDELRVIWAEWEATIRGDHGSAEWIAEAYPDALKRAESISDDRLADEIWDKAAEQATCDNGGWNAWLCPYGCGCHTVPFSRTDES